MASKQAVDNNVIFLYHCLQTTGAKIDFNEVAVNTGLNTSAARMRYVRLKDKILSQIPPEAQPTSKNTPSKAAGKPNKKSSLKANGTTRIKSTKRKHSQIDYDDDLDDSEADKQIKLEVESPGKRQTRGKKIDFTHFMDDESSNVESSYVDGSNDADHKTDDAAGDDGSENSEAEAVNNVHVQHTYTPLQKTALKTSSEEAKSSTECSKSKQSSDGTFVTARSYPYNHSDNAATTGEYSWKNNFGEVDQSHLQNEFAGFRSGMMVHINQIGNRENALSVSGDAPPNYAASTNNIDLVPRSLRVDSDEMDSTTSLQPNDSVSSAGQNGRTTPKPETATSMNS